MSGKKVIVAESMIPQDLTTMTMGSNYGLDGYEDMSYGMGVLEGVLDPAQHLPPALPTGLSKGAAEQLDLDSIIHDTQLNDLRWLSDFEPDPSRLPDKPKSLDSVSQLQELWGENRALTQKSAHETDLAVLRDRGDFGVRRAKAVDLGEIARKASRRIIAKVAAVEIAREATLSAGGDAACVRGIVGAVEQERGLAGNVFIRAASFPGYGQGKWKGFIAQHAKSARYLIVDADTIKSAAWVQDGRCVYTGKTVVTTVPWTDAYAHYAPRLKAAGYTVPPASIGPRKALQMAFRAGPQHRAAASNLPTHEGGVKKLGESSFDGKAASAAFEESRTRSLLARVEKIRARVAAGEKGTILQKRVASMFSPAEGHEAAKLLAPILRGALKDAPREIRIAQEVANVGDIRDLNRAAAIDAAQVLNTLEGRVTSSVASKVASIQARIEKGERGEILRRRTASLFSPSEQVLASKSLAPFAWAFADKPREVKVARDSGERFVNVGPKNEELAMAKKASAGAEKIVRVREAVGWVRRAMNEGLAGKNLDDAVRHRFTDALLKEASENIAKIRSAHEGLAGFRYIDASVYASKDGGANGCESGGLKHRANQVKMVLGMDRCGSCAMANALPDGMKRCSVYNKLLVRASDFDAADLRKAKAAAIKMANSHDAEHTASLFAPKYNQAEFGLHNAALDNIRPDDLPEDNKIKDIVMGGLFF